MSGATLTLNPGDFDAIAGKVEAMSRADAADLARNLAKLGVEQTQRRITAEKTSPAGAAWKLNRRGGSILWLHGALGSTISSSAAPWGATWGSNLVYAAIHNFGGPIKFKSGHTMHMPQREYLGLSDANAQEMEDLGLVWLQSKLQ